MPAASMSGTGVATAAVSGAAAAAGVAPAAGVAAVAGAAGMAAEAGAAAVSAGPGVASGAAASTATATGATAEACAAAVGAVPELFAGPLIMVAAPAAAGRVSGVAAPASAALEGLAAGAGMACGCSATAASLLLPGTGPLLLCSAPSCACGTVADVSSSRYGQHTARPARGQGECEWGEARVMCWVGQATSRRLKFCEPADHAIAVLAASGPWGGRVPCLAQSCTRPMG